MKLQKLTSLSLAAFTLTALANTASAYTAEDSLPYTSQFYLGSKVGVSFMDLSTDCWVDTSCSIDSEATFTVNPFIGMKYNWSNNLGSRFEVEGFYHTNTDFNFNSSYNGNLIGTDATLKTWGMFFNAYLDFNPIDLISPYFGAGIGFAHNEFDVNLKNVASFSDSSTSFAAHVDAGSSFNITKNLAFDLSIRYTTYGSLETDYYISNVDLNSLDLLAGVRFSF